MHCWIPGLWWPIWHDHNACYIIIFNFCKHLNIRLNGVRHKKKYSVHLVLFSREFKIHIFALVLEAMYWNVEVFSSHFMSGLILCKKQIAKFVYLHTVAICFWLSYLNVGTEYLPFGLCKVWQSYYPHKTIYGNFVYI